MLLCYSYSRYEEKRDNSVTVISLSVKTLLNYVKIHYVLPLLLTVSRQRNGICTLYLVPQLSVYFVGSCILFLTAKLLMNSYLLIIVYFNACFVSRKLYFTNISTHLLPIIRL